jgi:drug/metabolite transporter (DMT)-like permease
MSRADLALLLICAVWGTTFALLRNALHVLSPAELVAYRFTLATLFLVVVNIRRLRGLKLQWVKDGVWIGVWLAAGYLTQVMGLRSITASRSAFITSMSIAIVPFVAFLALRTRPVLGESLGVALAVLGLVLFSADAGFSLHGGELWTLGCAAAFAVQIVVTHIVGQRSPTLPLSLVQTMVGAVAGWTLVLAGATGGSAGGGHLTPPREIPWGVLLYLSIVATAGVILLQTWALARTSSVKAGVLYATEPIFAAIFAVSFFGERMTPRELCGAGLILAGVVVSELWRPWVASRARRLEPRPVSVEALPPSDSRGANGPG